MTATVYRVTWQEERPSAHPSPDGTPRVVRTRRIRFYATLQEGEEQARERRAVSVCPVLLDRLEVADQPGVRALVCALLNEGLPDGSTIMCVRSWDPTTKENETP